MAAPPKQLMATKKQPTTFSYEWMSGVAARDGRGRHFTTVALHRMPVVPAAPAVRPQLYVSILPYGAAAPVGEAVHVPELSNSTTPLTVAAPASSTGKGCIVRIGDTVYAKSSIAACSSFSIGLVEDLWERVESIDGSAPRPECCVRLRWLQTINNIAISRARLPRGSQVRPVALVARGWLRVLCHARFP